MLVQRIAALDARCAGVGIPESCETVSRGIPANLVIPGRGTASRIGGGNLPMPADVYPAWGRDDIGSEVTYRGLGLDAC